MPRPGMCWWHVVLTTYATWLPGDPRGFRNRFHRIHSSGDYKSPPPSGEHKGLYLYNLKHSGAPVRLPPTTRHIAAISIVQTLNQHDCRVMIVCVSSNHAHILAEMPIRSNDYSRIITKVKTTSSASIRNVLPGRVWGRGDTHKLKRDIKSRRSAFQYILKHRAEGAFVWTYKDSLPDDNQCV